MKLDELLEAKKPKFKVGDKVIFHPKDPHAYDFGSKSLDNSPSQPLEGEVEYVWPNGKNIDVKFKGGSLNVRVKDLKPAQS